MKCLNLHAVGDLRLEEKEMPKCPDDEVLVNVKYCGICGSDIPRVFTKGTYHFPTVIGHEFSGIVTYDPKGELEGKKVAVFPLLPCFECDSCKRESYASCENYDYYGSRRDGGMAEHLAVKRWNLVFVPDDMPLELAAMCEPASVAHCAGTKLGDVDGKNIFITGAGPIGLIAGQWCKANGAKDIYYIDIDSEKIAFAKSLGFKEYSEEITIDAGIEGTGASGALASLLKAVKPQGTVVLMGNPAREVNMTQETYWHILRKELTLKGTWNSSYSSLMNDWKESIKGVADGTIDLTPLISHKFKIEDYKEAFELMRDRKEFYNKVMLEI